MTYDNSMSRSDQGATSAISSGTRSNVMRAMSPTATRLRELLDRQIQQVTQGLFDSVDDALFDMAENASSNQQQNHFFESMREVRIKRVDIEKQFTQNLLDDFSALFQKDSRGADSDDVLERRLAEGSGGLSGDSGTLSLMENDAVEEMVAVNTMVARYDKLLIVELAALDARLAHLAGYHVEENEANKRANPFSPRSWSDHFLSATRLLSIDIKARIVIFKLFEKTVLAELPKLCKAANEVLIRDGFLPNYRYGDRAQQAARGAAPSGAPGQGASMQDGIAGNFEQGFSHSGFSQLLGNVPQIPTALNRLWNDIVEGSQVSHAHLPSELSSAIGGLSAGQGPIVSRNDLIAVLNNLQQSDTVGGNVSSLTAEVQQPQNVLMALSGLLASANQGNACSLGNREFEVITLVSLLFQFVLDDRGVAEPMRVVISRLQIPVIKIALQDPEFFSQGFHPARRLVNELIQATIGWSESDEYHKDPLYQSVCGIVDRVLAEYENDPEVFSDLLADLKSTLTGEAKRSSLREKRLVDAEIGKDTSEEARNFVKSLLSAYPLDDLPDFVSYMVNEAWSNRLFLLYLQKGADSAEWKDAVQTLTFVLWSVDSARCSKDRRQILAQLPVQLKKLRQGFDEVNWPKQQCNQFFEALEELHLQIIQRSENDVSADAALDETHTDTDVDAGTEPQRKLAEVHPFRAESRVSPRESNAGSESIASSIDTAQSACDAVDAEYLEQAEQLGVGQWIELHESGKKKRCRLVAILRNNGKRIFVDRKGVKACEFIVAELAKRLESEEIVLLEDAQLFDKAMTSIISGLRKQKSLAASA